MVEIMLWVVTFCNLDGLLGNQKQIHPARTSFTTRWLDSWWSIRRFDSGWSGLWLENGIVKLWLCEFQNRLPWFCVSRMVESSASPFLIINIVCKSMWTVDLRGFFGLFTTDVLRWEPGFSKLTMSEVPGAQHTSTCWRCSRPLHCWQRCEYDSGIQWVNTRFWDN